MHKHTYNYSAAVVRCDGCKNHSFQHRWGCASPHRDGRSTRQPLTDAISVKIVLFHKCVLLSDVCHSSFLVLEDLIVPGSQESHPLATFWPVWTSPRGSGSDKVGHCHRILPAAPTELGTCFCLVNNRQGLHIYDTTTLFFQGIVSKNNDWWLFLISEQCEILSPLLLAFIYRCLYVLHKTSQGSVLLILRAGCAGWSETKTFSRNGETQHFQVKQRHPHNLYISMVHFDSKTLDIFSWFSRPNLSCLAAATLCCSWRCQ